MASTNKTPNYNLSQFIATDKPAWLTDVNGDMSKIDTAIKNVSDRVGVNETAITEAEANIEDNASNITALQATSSQHGTDITDLKAQDIIIRNDITNTNSNVSAIDTRVTALENQEASVEVRDISSSFPKANIVKITKYGKVVTLYIDGLTSATTGSNSGVGQLPSDALPATNMNQDIVAANTASRLRIYLPSNGAIGYYNYGSETGSIQTQFIITYIAQ